MKTGRASKLRLSLSHRGDNLQGKLLCGYPELKAVCHFSVD